MATKKKTPKNAAPPVWRSWLVIALVTAAFLSMYRTSENAPAPRSLALVDFFKLVDEGKWTIDKMFEMCSGVYNDLNSNGQKDIGDLYGQYTYTLHLDAFLTGSNIIMVNTNGEELSFSPEFLGEKTLGLQEKVRNFFIKIPACGNLNSQGIAAQVNGVQIVGDNDLFCFFFA